MWVEEGYDDFNSLAPAFDVDNEAFNSLVSDSMLANIVFCCCFFFFFFFFFLFKHILFHLHAKGMGIAQMLCYSLLLTIVTHVFNNAHSCNNTFTLHIHTNVTSKIAYHMFRTMNM